MYIFHYKFINAEYGHTFLHSNDSYGVVLPGKKKNKSQNHEYKT